MHQEERRLNTAANRMKDYTFAGKLFYQDGAQLVSLTTAIVIQAPTLKVAKAIAANYSMCSVKYVKGGE